MGFVAVDAVDVLDFDFSAYDGPHGIIKEPSSKAILHFQEVMRDLMKPVLLEMADARENPNNLPMSALLREAFTPKPGLAEERENAVLVAVADLCGGTPSLDDLVALPGRVQMAFVGWISGIFLTPKTPLATS